MGDTGQQYRLVGVVDHIGRTLQEGHYTATCARWSNSPRGTQLQSNGATKAQSNGSPQDDCVQQASWLHFDDRSVQKASSHRVVTCSSYILVYQCLSLAGNPLKSNQLNPDITGIPSEDES